MSAEMELAPAAPNPAGGFERLFVLRGDAVAGPVARIRAAPGATLPAPAAGAARRVRLLHFNDFHHHITLPDRDRGDVHPFAQMVRRVRAARAAAARDEAVLFLSGGDDHTGTVFDELLGWTPEEFVLSPAYAVYSAAGLDAAALGNHELDRGGAVLRAALAADARFPVLSANLHGAASLRASRDYFPAALGVAKGLRVALLGLTTPVDTRVRTALDPGLEVASPVAVLRHLLPALAPLADLVIVMSHCGYGDDHGRGEAAAAARHLAEGDLVLARAIAPLCDAPVVLLGAHTHTVLNERGLDESTLVAGVPILQAGGFGSHLGECEIALAPPGGRADIRARLHPLKRAGEERPEDYDAAFEAAVVAPILVRLERQLTEEIARVEGGDELVPAATLRQRFTGECALANFVSDAVVARSRDFPGGPVDLAITNATAINAGVPAAGPLTFQQWYAVMPFPDALQIARLTGRQLRDILVNNAKRVVRPEELGAIDVTRFVSRGFLHFSAGLRYELALGAGPLAATARAIALAGRPIEAALDREFRVAFTTYVGNGGYGESWNGAPIGGGLGVRVAGYDLRPVEKVDTGLILRNEVIAHLRAVRRLGPAAGARRDGRLRLA